MSLFESDTPEFYLKYLSANRPARQPQTEPMSVGSSFDAFVKAELHETLFGKGADPVYEFTALFESQVDPPNRDFALEAGRHCMESYKLCGAYDDLLGLLKQATEPPTFECTLKGVIGGAPFLGKPDCQFVLDLGQGRISIIFDWKVKSFCSKYAASPSKGYALCRDGFAPVPNKKGVLKTSQSHNKSHKLYMPIDFHGLEINRDWLENSSTAYADQCSLYGWLLGEPIGSEETVVFIDELACKPTGVAVDGEYPLVRIANHRARVKKEYQLELEQRVKTCWDAIQSGHIFLDETREENDLHIETLDDMGTGLASDGSDEENFYSECSRPQFMFKK
jgi:hypothetical protein